MSNNLHIFRHKSSESAIKVYLNASSLQIKKQRGIFKQKQELLRKNLASHLWNTVT